MTNTKAMELNELDFDQLENVNGGYGYGADSVGDAFKELAKILKNKKPDMYVELPKKLDFKKPLINKPTYDGIPPEKWELMTHKI